MKSGALEKEAVISTCQESKVFVDVLWKKWVKRKWCITALSW